MFDPEDDLGESQTKTPETESQQRLHTMKSLEDAIILIAAADLDDPDTVDYALIEIAAKHMVWSFKIENAVYGTIEEFYQVIRDTVKEMNCSLTDREADHILAVFDASADLARYLIEKYNPPTDSCRELDIDF